MITLCKVGGVFHAKLLEICGLSTDTKPTGTLEGYPITNGSTFLEMDTNKIFIYNQVDKVWCEM